MQPRKTPAKMIGRAQGGHSLLSRSMGQPSKMALSPEGPTTCTSPLSSAWLGSQSPQEVVLRPHRARSYSYDDWDAYMEGIEALDRQLAEEKQKVDQVLLHFVKEVFTELRAQSEDQEFHRALDGVAERTMQMVAMEVADLKSGKAKEVVKGVQQLLHTWLETWPGRRKIARVLLWQSKLARIVHRLKVAAMDRTLDAPVNSNSLASTFFTPPRRNSHSSAQVYAAIRMLPGMLRY